MRLKVPSNCWERLSDVEPSDDPERREEALLDVMPDNPKFTYDMHEVIDLIVDDGEFFEIKEDFAPNLIVGFARFDGMPVGIAASNPDELSGIMEPDSSDKYDRFIMFLDAFNIPLLTIADVPGYLPGSNQEWHGVIRHGAKLLWCYSEATVPKITVITRKAYGGAYDVMSSKHIRGDVNLAWPTAEIAVMGAAGAANIIHRKEIKEAQDSDAKRQEKIDEYNYLFSNPYIAASRGYIDAVIAPSETRQRLIDQDRWSELLYS